VVVHSGGADGIFNPGALELVRELTAEFVRLPALGAGDLMSLATEPGFRYRPGTYAIQTLLEPPLKTRAELDQLREDLRRIGLYTGSLVSIDGQSTAILIGVPPGVDRTKLCREVMDIVAAQKSALPPGVDDIGVTGAPVAEALLGLHILEDLGVPKGMLGISTRSGDTRQAWNFGLVPVAILVMMLVLLVSFRNVLAMLVPLPGVLATLVFVFGLMGWCGIPIYLTIAIMPVLLTVTGVINDVYLFNRYFTLLREKEGGSHIDLLVETLDKMVSPLTATSLATAVGFFSFCFSPLRPVRAFGVCAGVGALAGLLCSLTIVPALLALINPKRFLPMRRRAGGHRSLTLAAGFERLGMAVIRWRWCVLGLVFAVMAVTPLGLRRLIVQDSWTSGFDPDSDFSRVTRLVNAEFDGMHLLLVSCDAPQLLQGEIPGSALLPGRLVLPMNLMPGSGFLLGSPVSVFPAGTNAAAPAAWHTYVDKMVRHGDSITVYATHSRADLDICRRLSGESRLRFEIASQSQLDPLIIAAIDQLGAFIRTRVEYGVGGVLGPADYLRTTRFLMRPEDPGAKVLPASASEAWSLWNYYRFARGPRRLRQVVDATYAQSLTTIFLKDANFVNTAGLMSDIRAYEREHLAPKGIKVGFAGDVALSQTLIKGIVATQLRSLAWSLIGIFLVTAVLGGSWRWGVYCLLPSLLAVVFKFAVMGWLGIPLGVATSMFAAMTLGLGVNCAIHLLEAERQIRAAGAPPPEALSRALASTGPPALINTLALSLGFGTLIISHVPANARLGLLLALGLAICFLASMLILPVFMRWKGYVADGGLDEAKR
jgi:predicted RND superfamily exporter protein